jgi:uncharacterized protein
MPVIACSQCSWPVDRDETACPNCGWPPRSAAAGAAGVGTAIARAVPAAVSGRPAVMLAGAGRRFGGALIDAVICLFIAFIPFGIILGASDTTTQGQELLALGIALAIWGGYLVLCESLGGSTPGKGLVRLVVVTADGRRGTLTAVAKRNLTKVALTPMAAFFVATLAAPSGTRVNDAVAGAGMLAVVTGLVATAVFIETGERRRLGDRWAGTQVVRRAAGTTTSQVEEAFAAAALQAPPPAESAVAATSVGRGLVPWGWRRSIAGLLVAFAPEWMFTILALVARTTGLETPPTNGDAIYAIVATAVFDTWWIGWAWGLSLHKFKLKLSAWGFKRPPLATLWVVPVSLLVALLVNASWVSLVHPAQQASAFPRTATGIVLAFVTICVLAPVFEETFFRGFLFQGLEGSMGTLWAALLSGAIFAAVHLEVTQFVPLFAAGVLLAWTFRRTGSIWANIALHMVYNLIPFLVWAIAG